MSQGGTRKNDHSKSRLKKGDLKGERCGSSKEIRYHHHKGKSFCKGCLKKQAIAKPKEIVTAGAASFLSAKKEVEGKQMSSPIKMDPIYDRDIFEPQIRKTTPDYYSGPKVSRQGMQETVGNFLFWILVTTSIFVGLYSLASKFLPLNLPNFPFYPYIIAHAFIFLSIPRRIAWPLLIIVLLNLGSATFRNTFFSHFESTIWMVVVTFFFITASHGELAIILGSLSKRLVRTKAFLILPLTLAIYFGLISPFYFGVIKPGPYRTEARRNPEPYTYDRVYEIDREVINVEVAPREAARKYFVEGRQYAAKGNRAGFVKSIQLYKMALELIPNFSSAYAEIAYAYGSIGRILEESGENKEKVAENFKRAKGAIAQAKGLNQNNPHIWGVDAILQYYMGNVKKAESALIQARNLSQKVGYTDRVLQAMATMAKNRVDRVRYLLAIREIDPDNADLHNRLGIEYYRINSKESAKRMFERAKRLSPDFGKPYLNLALVYTKKEVSRLYREASERDEDLRPLISYYSNLFKVKKWLWRFYVVLVIVFIFRFFGIVIRYTKVDPNNPKSAQTNLEGFKKIRRLFFRCALLFIITYGSFEIYIHYIRQINGIDYMFPIGFLFF